MRELVVEILFASFNRLISFDFYFLTLKSCFSRPRTHMPCWHMFRREPQRSIRLWRGARRGFVISESEDQRSGKELLAASTSENKQPTRQGQEGTWFGDAVGGMVEQPHAGIHNELLIASAVPTVKERIAGVAGAIVERRTVSRSGDSAKSIS